MQNKSFDFIGKRKVFFIIAACVLVLGIVANIVLGTRMDIQFTGGTIVKYSYTGDVEKAQLQDIFSKYTNGKETYSFATNNLTSGEDTNPNIVSVTLPVDAMLSTEDLTDMLADLQAKLPGAKFHQVESSTVEATMGREFFGKCIVAIVLASVLMMVYVALRFRKIGGWSAGLIALLALINDVLIAYFVFVVFRIELDDNFVAVVLSILGYSLNGTIVIYDRIRENRRLAPRAPLSDVVNLSINQSFRRTLNSSITTFTAVACITVIAALYGLDSLLSFSVPMMFGIVSGFYTSTCLAAPLWVWMKDKMAARAAAKAEAEAEAKKAKKAAKKGKK